MTRVLIIALSMLLSGCITSTFVKTEALNFSEAIEETTNKLLVLNVLRARDKAPLHFADIPVIRESIKQSASFGMLQFLGRLRIPVQVSDQQTFGVSMESTPSFELSHLHSREFITGISLPIDPKVVKYWLDRGLDRRIVLLLFISAVEIVETRGENGPVSSIRVANSPRDAVDVIKRRLQPFSGSEALRCDSQSDFERFLKLFNTLRTFFATTYRERRLLARGVSAGDALDSKNLQIFAGLDHSKVQVVYDRQKGTYSLYGRSNEDKVAFCFYDDTGGGTSGYESVEMGSTAADRRSCSQSTVEVGAEDAGQKTRGTPIFFPGVAQASEASPYCRIYNRFTNSGPQTAPTPDGYPRLELRLHLRSVAEIFQFLGDLLHYQDEIKRLADTNPQYARRLNSPVTFGFCGDQPEPGCDDIFVRLDGDPCNARFSVAYRERTYNVANYDANQAACGAGHEMRKDHTLEILSVLHTMIGLHKSASEFRSTPAVQLLP